MLTSSVAPVLSETDKAQEWLSQFLPEDKSVALALLENLSLVSRDEFERDLVEAVGEFIQIAEQPIAMFAVREVEEGEVYLEQDGPRAVGASHGVGSEGDLAHLVRDLGRKYGVLDHPSKETMRSKRVRNIVVINDAIFSGDQVSTFITKHIYGDLSIKSWTSSGKIRLNVIVHSATRTGFSKVEKNNVHWTLITARKFADLTENLDPRLARLIKELCKKYGEKERIPAAWHLGYEQTFSGVVFPHKCPNTLPGILWYNKNGRGKPLFNVRGSFDYPVWPTSTSPTNQLKRILTSVGQPTLASLEWIHSLGEGAPLKIAILAMASRRIRMKSAMVERLGVSFVRVDQLVEDCINQRWMTSRRTLTDSGRAVLSAAKQLGFSQAEPYWPDPDLFYFLTDVGDHETA